MPNRSSVFLNVKDLDRALAFYKALGFKVTSSWKGDDGKLAYADLKMDGAELGLGAMSSNDDPEYRKWVSTPLGAGVLVYFTLGSGLDKVFAKAKKAGAVVEMEPRDRPYGRVAVINDLDGYVISLHQDAPKARKAPKKARGKGARAKKAAKKRVKR